MKNVLAVCILVGFLLATIGIFWHMNRLDVLLGSVSVSFMVTWAITQLSE